MSNDSSFNLAGPFPKSTCYFTFFVKIDYHFFHIAFKVVVKGYYKIQVSFST